MSSKSSFSSNLRLFLLFFITLLFQTLYLTHTLTPLPHGPVNTLTQSSHIPDVFIYRRSKKTGSSSMLDALLTALAPYNYTALYGVQERMGHMVRAESLSHPPRRILVAQHNHVTRYHTPGRYTVIADTVLDGYKQVTSFCRFVLNVQDCGEGMIKCLESKSAQSQNYYRWAGRLEEDSDTYIDLPLSAAHPALSTSVVRRVYPGVVLDVGQFNVAGSACEEDEKLRKVYQSSFGELEKQIEELRKRMLVLAGFPIRGKNVSLEDMLDAAEKIESGKYKLGKWKKVEGASEKHRELKRMEGGWIKNSDGKVVLNKA